MSEQALTDPIVEPSQRAHPRAFETILYGGLAVGILDGLAAIVNSSLRGVSPTRVFQYISSGLIGGSAYDGGLQTVLLGILLHFIIAFGVASVFYVLSRFVFKLYANPFVFGPLYGIAVYFLMGYIVSPLSQAARLPFSWSGLITGIIIHILFVGLPVALIANWSAKR